MDKNLLVTLRVLKYTLDRFHEFFIFSISIQLRYSFFSRHPSIFAGILFDNSERAPPQSTSNNSSAPGVSIGIDNAPKGGASNVKVKSNSASPGERSVIIPAGATFSIPLSYKVGGASTVVSGVTKALNAQGIYTTVRTIGAQQPKTSKALKSENSNASAEAGLDSTQRDENRYAGLGMRSFVVFIIIVFWWLASSQLSHQSSTCEGILEANDVKINDVIVPYNIARTL